MRNRQSLNSPYRKWRLDESITAVLTVSTRIRLRFRRLSRFTLHVWVRIQRGTRAYQGMHVIDVERTAADDLFVPI